jgi:hypothetical protein
MKFQVPLDENEGAVCATGGSSARRRFLKVVRKRIIPKLSTNPVNYRQNAKCLSRCVLSGRYGKLTHCRAPALLPRFAALRYHLRGGALCLYSAL